MRQKNRQFLLLTAILSVVVLLSSCFNTRSSYYFKTLKKDTTIQGFMSNDFESKIQKNDILGITVSSISKDMDDRFNATVPVSRNATASTPTAAIGYLVNEKGMITVHYVGEVKADGLTRKELKKELEKSLLPYMKEPIVEVQFLNHKITVLGEVTRSQVLNMPEEQLSLLDVIVLCGDVTKDANKRDVMVIREENNQKQIKHINLEDHSIFTSPWYYVKPNDIVYVIPDAQKYVKEENRRKLQTTLTLAVSGVSLAIVILNVIFK